jgi:hypothetical protein
MDYDTGAEKLVQVPPPRAPSRIESYSSLSTLASCAEKYRLSRIERLEAPGVNLPMHNGKVMAVGLKIIYEKGFNPDVLPLAQAAMRDAWGDVKAPLGSKKGWLTQDFAERRIELFVREREASPTTMESASVVEGFVDEMHLFEWKGVALRGAPDLVLRDANGAYIVTDTKCPTSSWISDHYWLKFTLGHQLRLYAAMVSQEKGVVVERGLINAIYCGEKALDPPDAWKKRKSVPSALREFSFTQHQIEEAARWVQGLVAQRDHHHLTGFWPRNEGACDDYGGCEFRDLCGAPSEMAAKARMMSNFKRKEAS